MPPSTLTIPLEPALQLEGGGTLAALTLTAPTCKATVEAEEAWEKSGSGMGAFRAFRVGLVSKASGVAIEVLRKVPISIMDQATAFISSHIDDDAFPVPSDPPLSLALPLDPPAVSGGITYTTLTVQEPLTGQVWAAETALSSGTMSAMRRYKMVLTAQVSGMPYAAVETLPASTINQAAAYCRGFMMAGRQTGAS